MKTFKLFAAVLSLGLVGVERAIAVPFPPFIPGGITLWSQSYAAIGNGSISIYAGNEIAWQVEDGILYASRSVTIVEQPSEIILAQLRQMNCNSGQRRVVSSMVSTVDNPSQGQIDTSRGDEWITDPGDTVMFNACDRARSEVAAEGRRSLIGED